MKPARILWVDAAKGFAIILVVFGHVLGGAMARQWVNPNGAFLEIYEFIYLFHMPLFFMISGLFCIESMRRSPIGALMSRTESIAWPYLLWDFGVRTAILPFASAFMSSPPADQGWQDRLLEAFSGELSWFLWTLYVMQILLIPVARLPTGILFIASLVASIYFDKWQLGTFNSVLAHMPFLLFGAMLKPYLGYLKFDHLLKPLALSLLGFVLLWIALVMGWTVTKPAWLLCGIVGSLASICLVQCFGKTFERRVLANIGVASLAIYILHPYFQRAAGELVFRVLGSFQYLELAIPTLCGVLGPLLVWLVAERYGALWLFRLNLSNVFNTRLQGHA